jgi:dihydroorotase
MELTLARPDDWHLHVRDGAALGSVIAHTARQFARAIIMPNLSPPVTDTAQARAYRERILDALPDGSDFEPLMTLYLTDNTTADIIKEAAAEQCVHAVKLYPAGATTHSDAGVTDIKRTFTALEAMQAHGLPLLVHAEVTDPDVDVFDRERIFIERVLEPLSGRFPQLKIVLEHVTTREGIDFVM